ncbi:hypothetical protein EI94DRAFT_294617 [Lactarius quietus]|nr:hypothetical protein EI94DRAFT_294617 [Lactarius quietus]
MSESLGSELSYGEALGYPAEGDTLSIPGEREPTEAAEQLPDSSDARASSAVTDPQNDNRLSLVSATSLEPRRRSRHHSGRHSHMHRDLAHMLSVSARDAKELRRGLSAAYNKLDQSRERASHAEKLALDILLRVREAEEEREKAMREASATHEELGRYKALLDSANGEIRRGQRLLQDQENLRYEAEADAARARDNARQMKQRRLIDLAREQGRKMGYDEGIQAGQRIGYYDGQGTDDGTKVYFNEGPRFREVFDESNYHLDDFDHAPTVQPNTSPPNDPGIPPLAPQATDPPYTVPQAQYDEIPAIPHDTSTPPSEVPYTSPLRRVQRAPSYDSSSTTTLPAAPVPLRAMSRAPPTLPTIPEVASTEVGSVSLRSRSLRDSPRMHSYIQPVPQAPVHNNVPPSNVPHLQDPATYEPPPGSMSPLTPRSPSHDNVFPSIVHPLQDRVAFEPPPGNVEVSPALAPQVYHHDVVHPSTVPAMQDRTAFEPPPGSVRVSPTQSPYGAVLPSMQDRTAFQPPPGGVEASPSLVPQSHDTYLSSFAPPPQDRTPFQPPPGSVDAATTAPVSGHFQRPSEQPAYTFASPRGSYDNLSNGNGATASERIRSPVQQRFASAPEATPSQAQGRHASVTRNAPSTVQENLSSAFEYPSSQVRERFPSTHSRGDSRTHAESVQLADELRNPEYSTGVRSVGSFF